MLPVMMQLLMLMKADAWRTEGEMGPAGGREGCLYSLTDVLKQGKIHYQSDWLVVSAEGDPFQSQSGYQVLLFAFFSGVPELSFCSVQSSPAVLL